MSRTNTRDETHGQHVALFEVAEIVVSTGGNNNIGEGGYGQAACQEELDLFHRELVISELAEMQTLNPCANLENVWVNILGTWINNTLGWCRTMHISAVVANYSS